MGYQKLHGREGLGRKGNREEVTSVENGGDICQTPEVILVELGPVRGRLYSDRLVRIRARDYGEKLIVVSINGFGEFLG